jgi:hypothetical protein
MVTPRSYSSSEFMLPRVIRLGVVGGALVFTACTGGG